MAQSLLQLAADFSRQLASSVSIGATTATLNSYTDSDGVALKNNVLYGFTIDKGANKEYIVATHLNGALSGVMNITRQGVASSGFAKAHRIGASVEITDWAILSRIINLLNGTTDLDAGTPLKYDGAPSQAQANALATVQFVLDTASGSTVLAFNPLTIDGVAGENITDGDWIYFDESDGQWYKTDADITAKSVGVKIGKARGTALAENGIPGGIFVYGVESEGTYTTGQAYYLSNTAGALSTTPGTNSVKVGVGDDNEDLIFIGSRPSIEDALSGGGAFGTPSSANKFLTETLFTGLIVSNARTSTPDGWFVCDGSAVSRATYSKLFDVIGTTYGEGNGSTTFNVPTLEQEAAGGSVLQSVSGLTVVDLERSSSQYLSIIDSSQNGLDLSGDLTLMGYFNFESMPAGNLDLIGKYLSSGNQQSYGLSLIDAGGTQQLRLQLSSDGSTVATLLKDVSPSLVTGVWYHIAVSYVSSSGIATFYIDGESIGSVSGGPSSIFNSTAPFTIGIQNVAGAEFMDGKVAMVKVFNEALDSTQVFRSISNTSNYSPVGFWELADLLDDSGNGNTLTNNNTAVFVGSQTLNLLDLVLLNRIIKY